MSAQEILQIFNTVGFPILCCGGLAWWVKYTTDKERDERRKLNDQHKEEMQKIIEQHHSEMNEITTALNNNTLVIQKLCDRLER